MLCWKKKAQSQYRFWRMTVRVFAPAKINLTLHVTGQRDDGYHLLDSLVAFAGVGDWVSVANSDGLTLTVMGSECTGVPEGLENSILQAARFFGQDALAFHLEKHLPSAAGIGGGTADAAAALRAISMLRNLEIPADVLALGADVPVCLMDRATRMTGIGGQLSAAPDLPDVWAVLVNPRLPVITTDVFRQLQRKSNAPMQDVIPQFDTAVDFADWLVLQRNDLQQAAISLQPEIATVLGVLSRRPGALIARMSGSGATCFALFGSEEKAAGAAKSIVSQHPDWWVESCKIS